MLALAALLPGPASAAQTAVSYLAGGTVYAGAGRNEGIAVGDTLEVTRGGAIVARLRVHSLSSRRAACDTFAVTGEIRVGDVVRYRPGTPSTVPASDSAAAGVPSPGPASLIAADSGAPESTLVSEPSSTLAPRVRGRVGVRFLSLVTQPDRATQLSQPAADVRLDATRLAGGRIDLAMDVRGRYTRNTVPGSSPIEQRQSLTRVYRLAGTLHDRGDRRRLTLGRQVSGSLSGVSLFDGAMFEAMGSRWSAGAFTGTQPDPMELAFSTDIVELGGYVAWRQAPLAARRWSMITGFVASRQDGALNRDFAFLQGMVLDSRWSVFFTQEVDVNGGWKRDAGEAPLAPTSTFVTARGRVARRLTLHAGFDNRRNVRLYRDRTTPETEFDDRYRTGGWTGASIELAPAARLDVEGRLSADAGDQASQISVGGHFGPIRPLGLALRARASAFRSDHTRSALASLGLAADPTAESHVELSGGVRDTESLPNGDRERVTWTGAELDLHLLRSWYAFGAIEYDRGEIENTSQAHGGLSWRF
jgi:hypothetical protein